MYFKPSCQDWEVTESFMAYLSLLHFLSHFVTSSEPVAFLLKNWFRKNADIFAEWTSFPKEIINRENSPPQKSSDQASSYLMDAQSVFAEMNDSSEYINPEIHLVPLKYLNR
jgi:hypothetical protein